MSEKTDMMAIISVLAAPTIAEYAFPQYKVLVTIFFMFLGVMWWGYYAK